MKQAKIYFLSVLALSFFSCKGQTGKQQETKQEKEYKILEKADWLLGSWENNFPEGRATESWLLENDSTYTGSGLVVIGKDTVSSETLRLEERREELHYIPTVSGQNGGSEVKFKLTRSDDKMLVFENPEHDFPQKITYTKISADSIVAEISGMVEGKKQSQQFPMSRKK